MPKNVGGLFGMLATLVPYAYARLSFYQADCMAATARSVQRMAEIVGKHALRLRSIRARDNSSHCGIGLDNVFQKRDKLLGLVATASPHIRPNNHPT